MSFLTNYEEVEVYFFCIATVEASIYIVALQKRSRRKGGVGKSFIAATLAQYKQSKGHAPLCIDTDPVNATFHAYTALDVQRLQIMEDDEINPKSFDDLIELVAGSVTDVIIDNGASAFVPLSHYPISNQVPALRQAWGTN